MFRQEATTELNQLKQLLIRDIMPQISTTAITQENLAEVLEDYHIRISKNIPSLRCNRLPGISNRCRGTEQAWWMRQLPKSKSDFLESFKLENPVMIYEGSGLSGKRTL